MLKRGGKRRVGNMVEKKEKVKEKKETIDQIVEILKKEMDVEITKALHISRFDL